MNLENENYTVASYASVLCLSIAPNLVIQNFKQIEKLGGRGEFGFFESISFVGNVPQVNTICMAHHQGMIITSIFNFLQGNILSRLFASSNYGESLQYLNNTDLPLVPVQKI